jgi:hypothetical protein
VFDPELPHNLAEYNRLGRRKLLALPIGIVAGTAWVMLVGSLTNFEGNLFAVLGMLPLAVIFGFFGYIEWKRFLIFRADLRERLSSADGQPRHRVKCPSCSQIVEFRQPGPYHSGFGNVGFLYDDAGTSTLVWSSFDPAYESIVGRAHPWTLTPRQQQDLEKRLPLSPTGGHFRFSNRPRCVHCSAQIGLSMADTTSYLVYSGSIDVDTGHGLGTILRSDT